MPIYEYECTRCGEVTEALQKVADPHLTDCPCCNGDGAGTLKRILSAHVVGGASTSPRKQPAMPAGCGRCGDPQGPCGMN